MISIVSLFWGTPCIELLVPVLNMQTFSESTTSLYMKVAGSFPTVVRLIFQLAWCGIYTQSNNTLQSLYIFYFNIKVLGVVVGLIYLRLSYNQENIQNFAGLLFFIVTNLSFASLQGVIFVSIFSRSNRRLLH